MKDSRESRLKDSVCSITLQHSQRVTMKDSRESRLKVLDDGAIGCSDLTTLQ